MSSLLSGASYARALGEHTRSESRSRGSPENTLEILHKDRRKKPGRNGDGRPGKAGDEGSTWAIAESMV